VTFKYIKFFNRKSPSACSKYEASGHTRTAQRYKLHNDWLSEKASFLKSKVLKSPCCSCVFVCLSVAFKFLTHVIDCYKSGVNIMMTLGEPRRLTFKFQTLSNNKVEDMRTFELGALGLAEHILCATRS